MGPILDANGSFNNSFLTQLRNDLATKYGRNNSREIDAVLGQLRTKSFSSGGTGASGGMGGGNMGGSLLDARSWSTMINSIFKNTVDVSLAGFYDRFANASTQISNRTIQTILNNVGTSIANFNPAALITGLLDGAEEILKDQAEINDKLIDRVFVTGGQVGALGEAMVRELGDAMVSAREIGMTVDDFMATTKKLLEESGRMVILNKEFIRSAAEASVAYTRSSTTITDNVELFRNVSLGLLDAAEVIERIGNRSVSLGLNAKQTSDILIKQMDKLNQFGFKDGINGLGRMVQEAQALNYNMENTTRLAESLYDPSKAIDLAANMQVLGGAVGDLKDPLKLMYDTTNNMEGLQTSILGAAKGLATYNQEQGRFEVTGANLRRAKAMADALGMSMGELTNTAVKAAVKTQALSEINMFPGLNTDQKEFLANLSQIKGGQVGFSLPDDVLSQLQVDKSKIDNGFVKMSDLNNNQLGQLKQIQENIARTSTQDLARQQFNATTQIYNVVNAWYLRAGLEMRRSDIGIAAIQKTYEAAANLQKTSGMSQNTLDVVANVLGTTPDEIKSKLKGTARGEELLAKLTPAKPDVTGKSMVEKAREEAEKTTPTTPTTPSTTTVIVKHEFGPQPNVMTGIGTELQKDPRIFNEWLNRKTPQLMKREYVQSY